MKWIIGAAFVLLGITGGGAGPAAAEPGSFLYITPTAGLWHWDGEAAAGVQLDDHSGFVYGGRVGFSPIEAFSGELVLLTGTNTAVIPASGSLDSRTLRLTQAEFSFLVNFQSIASERLYPFLDLGVGGIFRGGDPRFDDTHFAFHLGGGLKTTLSPKWALRLNVRDTFFTNTQTTEGSQDTQVTVDSVELSLGLEYRFLTLVRRGGGRLR